MRRWRAPWILVSSLESLLGQSKRSSLFCSMDTRCYFTPGSPPVLKQQAIPLDFLKWGSIGFCRWYSRFATGFAPLQPKPLDSIVDVERLTDRSAEDICSAWDDVTSHDPSHLTVVPPPKLSWLSCNVPVFGKLILLAVVVKKFINEVALRYQTYEQI